MTARQWGLLGFLSLLWGGSFFFTAIAGREIPSFTLVWMRVTIAALVLVGFMIPGGYRFPQSPPMWRDFAVMAALANAVPFVLIAYAQTQLSSGIASVLNASTPLWTVIVAHVLTCDDKITPGRLVGVLVGMVGVATLAGLQLSSVGGSIFGIMASIAATISYGFAGVFGRRFKDTPPIVTSAAQLLCSSVMLVPFALILEHPFLLAMPSHAAMEAVAGLAVLSTALAFVIFFGILAEAGASNAMLVTLLVPVSATALGIVFLGEPLTGRQIGGGALIGLALLIIDGRLFKFLAAGKSFTLAKARKL